MASCAFEDCGRPDCPVCVVSRRAPVTVSTLLPPSELKATAPALNGIKPRAMRDPRFIQRKRKALR